jgi:5-hydroxyisourate hydrolase
MSTISTHVLNTSLGRPATDVRVRLELKGNDGEWELLWEGRTDSDGRVAGLSPAEHPGFGAGVFRITFATGEYFSALNQDCFYPYAAIVFQIQDPAQHYHVPLLLNPFGYSTYRGS